MARAQDEEKRTWAPRSILAVTDRVNSVRWAWILLQLGEEDHVHSLCDWVSHSEAQSPTQQVGSPPHLLGVCWLEDSHGYALWPVSPLGGDHGGHG